MIVGFTYNSKEDVYINGNVNLPDDYFEEFDRKETIDAITDVLESLGHKVIKLGYNVDAIIKYKPMLNIVFNIAEGMGGRNREGLIPSVLDYYGIPYTGSDATALNISLDKNLCKAIAKYVGVNTPDWQIINENDKAYNEIKRYPVIVKPLFEGSSKGILESNVCYGLSSVVEKAKDILMKYREDVLIEQFIVGYDYTVGILDGRVIGMMKIMPSDSKKDWVYSLERKRDYKSKVKYIKFEEKDDSSLYWQLHEGALKVYNAIGCRDFARVDFRVNEDGLAYFLEINPLAGLNPKDSDFVILAKMFGYKYEDLIKGIFESALKRYGMK